MRNQMRVSAAFIGSLLLIGCGSPTMGTAPVAGSDAQAGLVQAAAPAELRILSVDATSVGTTTDATEAEIEASSVHNKYFAAAHLTDGNLHSAWAPARFDAKPMVTMRLDDCMTLEAIGIKMSGKATFDVQVSTAGGTWRTVARNVSPQRATMARVALTGAGQADAVRLVFHGNAADLLVCEVKAYGRACGTAPTPKPSAMPTTAPTPKPSAMPTMAPTPKPSTDPSSAPSATPSPVPSDDDGDSQSNSSDDADDSESVSHDDGDGDDSVSNSSGDDGDSQSNSKDDDDDSASVSHDDGDGDDSASNSADDDDDSADSEDSADDGDDSASADESADGEDDSASRDDD